VKRQKLNKNNFKLLSSEEYKQQFLKILKGLSNRYDLHTIFSDFIVMSAIAYKNVMLIGNDFKLGEERYFSIIKKYDAKELHEFPKMLGIVTLALENLDCDFLGDIYMELEISNNSTGQYFTPFHLCKLIADMNMGSIKENIEKNGFVTVSDPAGGSGGMIIALAKSMRDCDLNYQTDMHVSLVDVHETVAYMAYIQLYLLHIPATITVGNSLSLEVREVLNTLAHHLGFWDYKLKQYYKKKLERVILFRKTKHKERMILNV
jgi:type I restriction-modification system DNA methylase subunit